MIRKYLIPLMAIAGILFAIRTVMAGAKPVIPAPPVDEPARAPFQAYVAGNGIVEPSSENIAIGATTPGVVQQVHVKVGQRVKAGQVLFTIDERTLQAQLEVTKAAAESAKRNLEKLRGLPRQEEVPPAEARVAAARSALDDLREQLSMWESVSDARAISAEELSRRKFAVQSAEARLMEAEAQLTLLKAGAWTPDVAIAEATLASAEAQSDAVRVELDRLTVASPIDGQVLQVNVRAGEYAPAGVLATPLMVVGSTDVLHVRVNVDENDAWRVKAGSAARAYVRGNSELSTPIDFVRIEPFVIPKRSLTGESTERVDTRVLQVLFSFKSGAIPVYVGQQMDVFIESGTTAPSNTTAHAFPAPNK